MFSYQVVLEYKNHSDFRTTLKTMQQQLAMQNDDFDADSISGKNRILNSNKSQNRSHH